MKSWRGIRAISFDVGGTLIDPWPSVGHVYAAVASEFGLPQLDPVLLNERFAAAWRTRTQFNYSRAEWADLVVGACGLSADQIGLGTPFFERVYSVFTEARVWHIHDDVLPTFQALRKAGLKMAVVSNWDDRLRRLLCNLELDSFFCAIEVSGESGYHKPSPEIFRRVLTSLGLPPEAVLHVGDSFREDFQGAQSAGLQARWLRRRHGADGPNQVASLKALLNLEG